MSAWIEVGGNRIGSGQPCFVIAEIGVNHNGDVGQGHRLIDNAARAGADAVKFQAFSAELVAAAEAPKAAYQQERDTAPTQRDMLSRLALDEAAHVELKAHAEALGLVYFASPFDEPSMRFLVQLGVPAIKVPSGEATNPQLLARAAESGVPILMSTGMCTLEEVDAAIAILGDARDRLALFHCVSTYPAAPADCNLRAMDLMRARYDLPVGWSDHTEGITVALAAVALGASLVEKHLTLDRNDIGPDHAASIEPPELRSMIEGIRMIEAALGEAEKAPTPGELEIAAVARRSLHWSRGIDANVVVAPEDLVALRPGTGVPPSKLDEIVGSRTRVAVAAGTMVSRAELEVSAVDHNR